MRENLTEYSLFFEQVNTWQALNKAESLISFKYPQPVLQMTVKARNLPDALKMGWSTVTHSDTALLSYVGFLGVYLPVEKRDMRAQMLSSYYNAELRRIVSEKRLNRARIQFQDIYGDELKAAQAREQEARYKSAGKSEAIKEMFASAFGGEIMATSDIFLLEYLHDVAGALESASDREMLEELLADEDMDVLREILFGGILPNGKTIFEQIPIAGWEVSECYFLTDYNGYSFLGEYESEVSKSVRLAVDGDVSMLQKLLSKSSDMRPFATEITKLYDAKLYDEIDIIASGLRKYKVRIGSYFTKEQLEQWQNRKEAETTGKGSLMRRLEEKTKEVKARDLVKKTPKHNKERG